MGMEEVQNGTTPSTTMLATQGIAPICHIQKRKTKREEREGAIKIVLADR